MLRYIKTFYELPEDSFRIKKIKETQVEQEPDLNFDINKNSTSAEKVNSEDTITYHKYLSKDYLHPPMKFQINSGLI